MSRCLKYAAVLSVLKPWQIRKRKIVLP
jgi:hypothetical protein